MDKRLEAQEKLMEPSKWALERALKFNGHIECKSAVREGKQPCGFCADMALEFDAIVRERDEAAEKLAEALQSTLNVLAFESTIRRNAVAALAAWRGRKG